MTMSGDSDSVEDYVVTCTCISALYNDCNAVRLIVAGDFNCQFNTRLSQLLVDDADDVKFIVQDVVSACKQQKTGKAAGLCVRHGHVPDSLTQSFMVPGIYQI